MRRTVKMTVWGLGLVSIMACDSGGIGELEGDADSDRDIDVDADVDPCYGADCSGHGRCVSEGGAAHCVCEEGYHAEGLACVPHATDGDADTDVDGDADVDSDGDADSDACTPDCDRRECGSDGCGGSCGSCEDGVFCSPSGGCGCRGPEPPLPTAFGFNYAPPGGYGTWLSTDHEEFVEDFARDLVIMASLGATVVRIPVLPYRCGMQISEGAGPGSFNPEAFEALSRHLPGIIESFGDHGISVILSFHPNSYYTSGPDDTTWTEVTYGPEWHEDFTEDLIVWSTDFVELVETSEACSNVLYYDVHNELHFGQDEFLVMVQAQHERVPIPEGKRGQSLLFGRHADEVPAVMAAAGRTLDFIDFHTYLGGINTDVYDTARSISHLLPGAHLILGEFGAKFEEGTEVERRDFLLYALDQAERADMTAALHWSLWDFDPDEREAHGLGHRPNEPRDSYGAIAERHGRIPSSDFESSLGDWYVGGSSDNVTLRRQGPLASGAATGEWYGRLTATAEGSYWFCSPMFEVDGTKLAVSGYVRSNVAELSLNAHMFDDEMRDERGRLRFSIPRSWSYWHVQDQLGGQVFDMPAGTTRARICVTVTAPAGTTSEDPIYLDLDAFSAGSF